MSGLAHGFQHIERAERIDLEIVARIGHRSGHRHLRGQMQNPVGIPMFSKEPCHARGIPDVQLSEFKRAFRAQPLQIFSDAFAAQVIHDHDHDRRGEYRLAALQPMKPAPPVMMVFIDTTSL